MKRRIFLLIVAATLAYCGIGNIDRNNSSDPKASNYSGGAGGSGGSGGSGGGSGSGSTSTNGNIMVPIEMVDLVVGSSNVGLVNFQRTKTSLTSTDYDGSPAYYFEIVAMNTNVGSAYNVQLMDNAVTTKASITVPANTTSPTRYRVAFTPNAGLDKYTIQLPATTANNDVLVTAARMIVVQTNATKTAVWIPMAHSPAISPAPANFGQTYADTSYVLQITAVNTIFPGSVGFGWTYSASRYAATSMTVNFEAVTYYGTSPGSLCMYDGVGCVTNSTISINATVPTWAQTPAVTLTDGTQYLLRGSWGGSGAVVIAHVGIWIKLTGFTKVETYNRLSLNTFTANSGAGLTVGSWDYARIAIDPAQYGSPKFMYEGYFALGSGSQSLVDLGTGDSGTGSAVVNGTSTVTYGSSYMRSGLLTLTSPKKYGINIGTAGNAGSGYLVIQSQ